MLRPLSAQSEWGSWDQLSADPDENVLDLTSLKVKEALGRREKLKKQWLAAFTYPQGVWSEEVIRDHPHHAEAWRNWLLRRAWEGISYLDGCLRIWSRCPGK